MSFKPIEVMQAARHTSACVYHCADFMDRFTVNHALFSRHNMSKQHSSYVGNSYQESVLCFSQPCVWPRLIVRARVAACRCATSLLPARERPQLLRSGADEKHPYEQQLQGSKCPHLLQTQEAGAIPTTRVQAKSQCKESQRVAA
eukprot:402247-Pleurochrysis_carterae.AAC.2